MVTGGNSGTGYATCKAYYDRGAKVYMASRSESRAKEAIQAIKDGHDLGFGNSVVRNGTKQSLKAKGQLVFAQIDLTDLDSVEECVEEIKRYVAQVNAGFQVLTGLYRKESKIDVLFANAGIMATLVLDLTLDLCDLTKAGPEDNAPNKATVYNLAQT